MREIFADDRIMCWTSDSSPTETRKLLRVNSCRGTAGDSLPRSFNLQISVERFTIQVQPDFYITRTVSRKKIQKQTRNSSKLFSLMSKRFGEEKSLPKFFHRSLRKFLDSFAFICTGWPYFKLFCYIIREVNGFAIKSNCLLLMVPLMIFWYCWNYISDLDFVLHFVYNI
jgi:hypothetical protein